MNNKLLSVSMNGRMAYVIMCVEAYLSAKYPERDWTIISQKLWQAISTNWSDWPEMYSCIIPDVLFHDEYSNEDYGEYLSEEEYLAIKKLYDGLTEGIEDDPDDELNYMLNKPFEMAMVYEGTVIGDGKESFEIVEKAEQVLERNGIELPDYTKVLFSSADELNGWGDDFDGRYLSIILNR